MHDTDIAIVGAGPAAMAAALEAGSHGYSAMLIAPSGTFTDNDDRTTALMMPAIRMLRKFDTWESLASKAAPLKSMRIIDGTSRLIRAPVVTFDASEIGEEAFGFNIANRDLNMALSDAIEESVAVERIDAMASSASFAADRAAVTLNNGGTITARLVVAADGMNSIIRECAAIGARRWSYPQTAVVLTFRHVREHNFISTEFHTESGPFTIVPMPGKRSSLVWVVAPEEADRLVALERENLAATIERRMDSMLGPVSDLTEPQTWPLSGMVSHSFAADRLMLAGHAAHVFPPIGAQGLNLGMRDIADFGRCIAGAHGDPGTRDITRRYDRMRRADIASRTGAVDLLNRSLLTGFLPVQFIRAAGLGVLGAVRPLRSLFMREGMEPGSGIRALFSREQPVTETDRV